MISPGGPPVAGDRPAGVRTPAGRRPRRHRPGVPRGAGARRRADVRERRIHGGAKQWVREADGSPGRRTSTRANSSALPAPTSNHLPHRRFVAGTTSFTRSAMRARICAPNSKGGLAHARVHKTQRSSNLTTALPHTQRRATRGPEPSATGEPRHDMLRSESVGIRLLGSRYLARHRTGRAGLAQVDVDAVVPAGTHR